MNPRDDVILSYSGMEDGTSLSSQTCPMCGGGSSQERSMSVGMSDGLLWWNCHRASCSFKGGWRGAISDHATTPRKNSSKVSRKYQALSLPEDVALMMAERWNVPSETFAEQGWSYTPDFDGHGNRVIMPVRDPHGRIRGRVFRSYWGAVPKAFTESIPDTGECIAWQRATSHGRTVVVVEDIPSAFRLMCAGQDAVALLGTTLNNERINEIKQAGFKLIVLTLDNDATMTAVEMVLKLGATGMINVKPLDDKDIKDMDPADFNQYVEEVRAMSQ